MAVVPPDKESVMHFEYKALRFAERNAERQLDMSLLEKQLNELGKQGWDLVGMNVIGSNTPIAVYAVLKRSAS